MQNTVIGIIFFFFLYTDRSFTSFGLRSLPCVPSRERLAESMRKLAMSYFVHIRI